MMIDDRRMHLDEPKIHKAEIAIICGTYKTKNRSNTWTR